MIQPSIKTLGIKRAGRLLLLLLLLLVAASFAVTSQAQTALPDESATAALQCLQRRATPPKFPEHELRQHRADTGYLRVKLVFTQPGEAPAVEVLANTASELKQDEVLDYLRSYRLPCMKPEFGPVSAVQEFVFDAFASPEGKPLRLNEADLDMRTKSCVVMPRTAPEAPSRSLDRGQVLVRVVVRFAGDGAQPPTVMITASDASRAIEGMVLDYLAAYRMPCRVAGDKPYSFNQTFQFAPHGSARAGFTVRVMPLKQFLSYMKNVSAEPAYFDFNSMACPFKLDWTIWQPQHANEVHQVGKRDANRSELTAWLASLQMDLPDRRAKQLFGERLLIEVPCGVLDFRKPVAAG